MLDTLKMSVVFESSSAVDTTRLLDEDIVLDFDYFYTGNIVETTSDKILIPAEVDYPAGLLPVFLYFNLIEGEGKLSLFNKTLLMAPAVVMFPWESMLRKAEVTYTPSSSSSFTYYVGWAAEQEED